MNGVMLVAIGTSQRCLGGHWLCSYTLFIETLNGLHLIFIYSKLPFSLYTFFFLRTSKF